MGDGLLLHTTSDSRLNSGTVTSYDDITHYRGVHYFYIYPQYPQDWMQNRGYPRTGNEFPIHDVAFSLENVQIGSCTARVYYQLFNWEDQEILAGYVSVGETVPVVQGVPPDNLYKLRVETLQEYGGRNACRVTIDNHYYGLEVDDELHVVGSCQRLYYYVPPGVPSFTVRMRTPDFLEYARLNVRDADGQLRFQGSTSIDVDSVRAIVTVPADQSGRIWSILIDEFNYGSTDALVRFSGIPVITLSNDTARLITPAINAMQMADENRTTMYRLSPDIISTPVDPTAATRYRGSFEFLLYGMEGDTIDVWLKNAGLCEYTDSLDYELHDPYGDVQMSGKLPRDVEGSILYPVEFTGLHRLNLDSGKNALKIQIANMYYSIRASSGIHHFHEPGMNHYFYVPSDIQSFFISAKTDPGELAILKIWNGDGDSVTTITVDNDFAADTIYAGGHQDEIWSYEITEAQDVTVLFDERLPRWVSNAPERLLVPFNELVYHHRFYSDHEVSVSGTFWIGANLLDFASVAMEGDRSWGPGLVEGQYYTMDLGQLPMSKNVFRTHTSSDWFDFYSFPESLYVVDRPGYLREDGVLFMDGDDGPVPFWAQGLYQFVTADTVMEDILDHGFNILETTPDAIELVKQYGFKAAVALYHCPGWQCQMLDDYQTIVNTHKDSSYVAMWMLPDEPQNDPVTARELLEVYYWIRENDPNHPVYETFANPYDPEAIAFSYNTDLFAVDPYPIWRQRPLTWVSDIVDQGYAVIGDHGTVVSVLEAGWITDSDGNITKDQERAMTYLSLIHGSNGHLYYAYETYDYANETYVWWLPNDNSDLWNYFIDLNQEMEDLAGEVLLKEKLIDEYHLLEDSVQMRLIELEEPGYFVRYIIALNPDTLENADIRLDESYLGEHVNTWEFYLMDDGLIYQYVNGTMDVTLRPLERFVLKIRRRKGYSRVPLLPEF